MLKELKTACPYVATMSDIISRRMNDELYNTYTTLRKFEWRKGTSPQGSQLLAVQNFSTRIEEIWETYFATHLKVVRLLGDPCNQTRDCLRWFQIYRKKGVLELLQALYPDLGIGSTAVYYDPATDRVRRRVKKGTENAEEPERYTGRGVRDEDWKWRVYKGKIMKVPIHETRGTPLNDSIRLTMNDRTLEALMLKQDKEDDAIRMELEQAELEKPKIANKGTGIFEQLKGGSKYTYSTTGITFKSTDDDNSLSEKAPPIPQPLHVIWDDNTITDDVHPTTKDASKW